ncbi:MAG: MBL fold metallo-hydrolase [Deltaproteobacteria bacterium]|nr:MBL fold metallo-hydrolase [Deltaproteobacteria bacterium]
MIIKQMTVGPMAVFCYIVGCAESLEGVLIDPAGSEEQILRVLDRKKLKTLYIINTHGHPDHTCGNQILKERTGARIVMHAAEARMFDTPSARIMAQQMGFRPSPPVDWTVRDGDLISFGRETLRVVHTPGHTPGGICLYGRGNLFTGDTLFVGAAGRTDLPGGALDTLIDSLRNKIGPLPDETVIRPGHDYGDRPTSTLGREKKTNPYYTDF